MVPKSKIIEEESKLQAKISRENEQRLEESKRNLQTIEEAIDKALLNGERSFLIADGPVSGWETGWLYSIHLQELASKYRRGGWEVSVRDTPCIGDTLYFK